MRCGALLLCLALLAPAALRAEKPLKPNPGDEAKESTLLSMGDLDNALAGAETVLGQYAATLGEDHPSTAIARRNLAMALWAKGRLKEAEAALLRAWSDLAAAKAPDADLAHIGMDLGLLCLRTGRKAEAEGHLLRALKASEGLDRLECALLMATAKAGVNEARGALGSVQGEGAAFEVARGRLALALGEKKAALAHFRRALAVAGIAPAELASAQEGLGDALKDADPVAAANAWSASLDLYRRMIDVEPCRSLDALEALVHLAERSGLGKPGETAKDYRKAAADCVRSFSSGKHQQ